MVVCVISSECVSDFQSCWREGFQYFPIVATKHQNSCSKEPLQSKHRSVKRECAHTFKKNPIGAPSVRAQISCSAVYNASWQSRDTLKRQQHQNAFFWGVWLGRGQWDEFHHLASIQKGIIELYDAACEISTELAGAAGAFGALRFCLLVNELHQIQWPQKPLTMEVLDEIHAANMHNWSTNAREARLGWKQSSVRGDASSVGTGENGDFVSSLGAQSWLSAGCLSSSYRFWALQTLPIGAVASIRRPVVAITLWSSPRAR